MDEKERPDPLFTERLFAGVDLPEELHRAVSELGFERLTQVQDQVLPLSLAGRDVVAQAQTGSGKTAAYLLTIFAHLLRVPRTSPADTPRALVIAPTRELAVQIAGDAEGIGRHTGLKVHVVFGGLHYRRQREVLEAGTDILIGTPGRLIDYHQQRAYSLAKTEILVIDECDRLFDMGFADDLERILRNLPHPRDRQSLMFSATISQRVMIIGLRHMNAPQEVIVSAEQLTPQTVSQTLLHVGSREKLSLLLGLLAREAGRRTMIFVNTRATAFYLVEELRRHGYHARGLTGNVIQSKRLRVLDDFRDGHLPILVATDVASRGLHIEGVSHVINYDLPQDVEDYVHRIGRTARVGADGAAITLACEDYVWTLDALQRFLGYEIPTETPDPELFAKLLPRGMSLPQRQPPPQQAEAPETPAAPASAEQPAATQPAKRRHRRRRKRTAAPPATTDAS